MNFQQAPPALGSQYTDDRVLRSYLARVFPAGMLRDIEGPLAEMGRLAGARRFSLTLSRTMELALLIRHAQWSQDHEGDSRSTIAARRFASSAVDLTGQDFRICKINKNPV